MAKHKPKPCNCGAYNHPHRLDGGKCKDFYNSNRENDAELARDFMREEVDAYNKERSIFEQVRNLT